MAVWCVCQSRELIWFSGGYACGCHVPGWAVDENGECEDVDECATQLAHCDDGKFCVNEIGEICWLANRCPYPTIGKIGTEIPNYIWLIYWKDLMTVLVSKALIWLVIDAVILTSALITNTTVQKLNLVPIHSEDLNVIANQEWLKRCIFCLLKCCLSSVKGYKAFERAGHLECIDIDECLEINPCQTNEICTNLPGGYDCDCRTGLEYNSNRESGMHLMSGTCVVLKFEFQSTNIVYAL